MKYIYVSALFISLMLGNGEAQVRRKSNKGLVKVSLTSLDYVETAGPDSPKKLLDEYRKMESYVERIYLKGNNFYRKMRFTGRRSVSNYYKSNGFNQGGGDYFIFDYEIEAPPGVYRIVIVRRPDFRYANFVLDASAVVRLNLHRSDFFYDDVCMGGERIIKFKNRKYSSPPYGPVLMDVLVIDPPFEMVVRYCQQEKAEGVIRYKTRGGVDVFYKNISVTSDDVTVDLQKMVLMARSDLEECGLSFLNGGAGLFNQTTDVASTGSSLELDLRNVTRFKLEDEGQPCFVK